MKDIPMIRIFRYALAATICLFIVANVLSNEARAETGTVDITASTAINFTSAPAAGLGVPLYDRLLFDTANYNSIDYLDVVTDTNNSFLLQSNFTFFTCQAPNTCTGGVSYSRTGNIIEWAFDAGAVITSSPIIFTYNENIFDSNNIASGNGNAATFGVNSTIPVCLAFPSSLCTGRLKNAAPATTVSYYRAVVMLETSIDYNITYPLAGKYSGSITKYPPPITKIIFEQQNGSIDYSETSFNNVSFNLPILTQGNGIYINATMQNTFRRVLINGTGVSPGQGVGSGGSASGQINYNYNSATVGQTYGVNASITVANYSSFDTYYIYAYDINNALIPGFPASFNTQNYNSSKLWTFNAPGSYHANLSYCGHTIFNIPDVLCTSGFTSKTFLDTATVYIPPTTYAYSITTDKNSYLPGETILYTINNPSPSTIYMDVFNPDISGFGVTELGLNVVIPAGSSGYTISRTIPDNLPKDNYTAYLISSLLSESEFNIYASTDFNITTPNSTSNTLFMGWDFSTYTLGDSGKLTTVSDYNPITVYVVSPGGVNKTYIFPANSTNNTMISFNEIGAWKAQLVNDTDYILFRNVSVFGGAPIGNETFSNCLFSANYVCWDNKQYEQGDPYTISFRLEITSLYTYNPYIAIVNPNGKIIANISINGSYDSATSTYVGSTSGSFTPQAVTGVYYARLMPDQLGRIGEKTSSAATVIAKVSATPTEAGTTTSDNLLNSGFFAALLIMIVFVGIGMEIGGAMGAVVGFGGGFIVSAIYDLVPTWAVYLFAILVLTSFAVMVGGKVAGGGNGGGD